MPTSLKTYNTFGIDAQAANFIEISSQQQLQELLSVAGSKDYFVLGGGSNMLLCTDIKQTVLHINNKGIREVSRTEYHITLEFQAGENWHDTVMYCVDHNYGGIENLALIPGKIGAAPIQNIGAYGVELKDVFVSCTAVEIATGNLKTFNLEDCQFGYRDSVFKNELKGAYIITSVCLKLSLDNHALSTSYGAINTELENLNLTPSVANIAQAVINIRSSKLPDPAQIGNSGSFFKNPVISRAAFEVFQSKNPDAPFYEVSETEVKVPAGWLIEHAGFKGKRFGDAGVHDRQALVLVNHGNATGQEIWSLAQRIQKEVLEKFGIALQAEVNLIGC
ncbi:UDP-N-acetylmuramate dehydrogenase [Gilvibacter sp.]|uniref:UDP-N-acetylmuramate dehydrogenase n=1 Tax=Gilvibacter sp. TaxID=2729997 RepID=UPI003F49FA1F